MNLDMNRFGLTRVAAATPVVKPGDPHFNAESIISILSPLSQDSVEIAAFPELSVTGYTCADLFHQQTLLDAAEAALEQIRAFSEDNEMLIIVGAPLRCAGALYNCAVAIRQGEFLGAVPKIHIPNYSEFYEKRWFKSGEGVHATVNIANRELTVSTDFIFTHKGTRVGVEICEDLWVPVPPSCRLTELGADIIVNLSATNEVTGKHSYLLQLIKSQSARCRCGYVYASAGVGESTTDLAFAGNAIIAENGVILAASPRFSLSGCEAIATIDVEALRADRIKYATFSDDTSTEDLDKIIFTADIQNNGEKTAKAGCGENTCEELLRYRNVNPHPFVNSDPAKRKETCDEISSIQAWGLANRLRAIGCMNAVVGISGGLDSTLALLVTVKAFDMLGLDRKGIVGITMPGFGTTGRTHSNANELMERLGVTQMEIPIGPAVERHFSDIGQNPEIHDITYENSQARERTQILMDMANKVNGLVIGTGDLSELALGWCTYNGDQMSMYGVNASVPKTLVKYLVENYADTTDDPQLRHTLLDIVDTPISPELLPAGKDGEIKQKTEDTVGPYELHDFFLHAVLRHGFPPAKILAFACKAFKGTYDCETIGKWLRTFYRRFFAQQFKRSCMPDGVKVGSVCLSPRGDWRMPSDASSRLWIEETDREMERIRNCK